MVPLLWRRTLLFSDTTAPLRLVASRWQRPRGSGSAPRTLRVSMAMRSGPPSAPSLRAVCAMAYSLRGLLALTMCTMTGRTWPRVR